MMQPTQEATFGVGIAVIVISSVVVFTRCAVRWHIKNFGFDDVLMVIAQVCAVEALVD